MRKFAIFGGAALAGLAQRIQPRVAVPLLCSVEIGAKAAITATAERRRTERPGIKLDSIGLSPALATLIGH